MSKKHFIALADAIRAHNTAYSQEQFTRNQLESIAFQLRLQNDRFDRERWLGYIAGTCGPNGGTVKSVRKERENEYTSKS